MRLSKEQVEQLTDLMVSKLSLIAAQVRNDPDSEHWLGKSDTRPLNRDEIRLTIIDTAILEGSDDPTAMLEHWLETA